MHPSQLVWNSSVFEFDKQGVARTQSDEYKGSVATVIFNDHSTSEAQSSNFADKAIPLLFVDEADNFSLKINENAARVLAKRTSNNVAVVSIFGEAGSGKSQLLN